MEQKTVDQIRRSAESGESCDVADAFLQSLEKHYKTGQREYFSFWGDDAKFKAFTDLVGQTEIDTTQVIGFNYEASAEHHSATLFDLGWSGECPLGQLQESLGDMGMMNEFPNDFQNKIAVQLDQETVIVYEYKHRSVAVVCDDCVTLEEYDAINGMWKNYSCDHCLEENQYEKNAVIIHNPTREDIDKIFSWDIYAS